MNKLVLRLKTILLICSGLGWWGSFYPEYTITPDSCIVRDEEGSIVELDGKELYVKLMQADKEQIQYKSRLFEYIKLILGNTL